MAGVDAVGHRVVHGGERFAEPRVDRRRGLAGSATCPARAAAQPREPRRHRGGAAALPDVPHVAVFDTAFHQTLPPHASTYAIPPELATRHGVRRYGFHGTSHACVSRRAARLLGRAAGGRRT